MTTTCLQLSCADLHPGCPTRLEGASTEELVLAYVVHDGGRHATGSVPLDVLLGSVRQVGLTGSAPCPLPVGRRRA